jgi:hypothetical protein
MRMSFYCLVGFIFCCQIGKTILAKQSWQNDPGWAAMGDFENELLDMLILDPDVSLDLPASCVHQQQSFHIPAKKKVCRH